MDNGRSDYGITDVAFAKHEQGKCQCRAISLMLILQDGPLVIIDSYGATEASIFCALASLVEQLDCESHVDVYYWFRTIHESRMGVWVSPDNLLFVYRVLDELCSVKNVAESKAQCKHGQVII